MIYRDRMFTADDYTYNFRILKLVTFLWKLKAIDNTEMAEHILLMDNCRAVGTQVDYTNFRVYGAPDGSFYQF